MNLLRQHPDARVRDRANALLGTADSSSREKVYQAFLPALQLTASAERGRKVFESRCAACHHHAGIGVEFGPNLANARSGGREKPLSSILDPNREVLPEFVAYAVETKEGESLIGFLENESATSVTLRQPGGLRKTIPRASLASLKNQRQSLMPEGLETGLSHQEMADLIEFVMSP
jgi:putative heme-binding domain-containing protein